ncbi:hypothetical protein RUM44_005075 [Polyplax serrata]|uniref:Rab-GAP TBC domain-containing protein n=1 Tax=Polyplax serrata TaxID=468196 RepID=A0ABR1ADZ3_POLSC
MLCPKFLAHDFPLMSDLSCKAYSEENETADNSFYRNQFFTYLRYENEWSEFFKKEEIDLEALKQKSVEGKLKFSYFRSIIWRILLGILHRQPLQWLCQLQMYRKHYNEIVEELNNNPWNGTVPSDNPLSQESESVWQKYFCDEELKGVIFQDVRRTFPDIDYFRNEDIQQIMIRILFCYARQNPVLCYRQGMHEILAPIMLVLHCDHQAYLLAKKQNPVISQNLSDVLSPEYLEHDAYTLFKSVMSHIQCSYKISSTKEEQKTDESEIITRLDYIRKNIFQKKDPDLYSHLEKLDIPMHLFGIRWLRLLFGREFPLQDLLILWDFLFSWNFENVNYIVVAMLVAVRKILLYGDYNTCLSILMKYPVGVDISWIISYVLHLKDSSRYAAPIPIDLKTLIHGTIQQKVPIGNITRLRSDSRRQPQWSSVKQNLLKLQKMESDDDFSQDNIVCKDVNVLETEIEHIKMVLSIVHHKLAEFHSLLKAKLGSSNNSDIAFIIDGIYELSSILKHYDSSEIETACEAGESKIQESQSFSMEENMDFIQSKHSETSISQKSHTLPRIKRASRSGELKVFKHQVGGSISGAPMTDPLYLLKNSNVSREQ